MTLIKSISYIGLHSLSNLKQFISSGKFHSTEDTMFKDISCYLENIDNEHYLYHREGIVRCRIRIISTAKTYSAGIYHMIKILKLVHKNDFTRISLEIIEEKERNFKDKYKILKHYLEAIIRIDLM